jgi:probable phosphoglycerate mutase
MGELAGADALYTSVLARSIETASIIAPGLAPHPAPVADCDLCELHPGEADGLSWEEFRVRYGEPDWDADPDSAVAPGGESWTGFVRRASDAVARATQAHPGGLVVVVCHAGVIESTLLSFLPVAVHRGRLRLPTQHTSLTEWELGPLGWRLMRYNDAAHLHTVAR